MCLLVAGRKASDKGARIVSRLTERFRPNELSADDQIECLTSLYRARNDAVHEGWEFADDLHVDLLLDLTLRRSG